MRILFNTILEQFKLDPARVILLRHQDGRSAKGRTPYELWRDNRPAFETYQAIQTVKNRAKFKRAPHWASFVVTPDGATMFVGMYSAYYKRPLMEDTPLPNRDGIDRAGSCDLYDLKLDRRSVDLAGKLFIDWGKGKKSWVQRAERQTKHLSELRLEYKEEDFPGYLTFAKPLSKLEGLPKAWITSLKEAKGVYVLTCPRTKEQYVGKADGAEGFWGRWMNYVVNFHGGNLRLKSREPSDYQVSILELAGSAATGDDILGMEIKWQRKLQSKEMGLN